MENLIVNKNYLIHFKDTVFTRDLQKNYKNIC